jgi:TetR/AcrR family transcriptional regulator
MSLMAENSTTSARMPAPHRRAQLLEAALNLFSEKGFDGATTREIAARAGVTEAIIFRHFPTKQALYQAVLESEFGRPDFQKWLGQVRECLDRNDDRGLFRTIAGAIIESYRSDPRMERVMLFAALEGNGQALEHYQNFCLPLFEILREYVVRRQREGALADHDPGAILSAIAGMAQRYAMFTQMFGFGSEYSDQEAADLFTHILMNGIQTK